MVSWAHNSPDPKQQLYRFSRCCTAHGRKSLYLIGHPFALKAAPTYGGSGPHLIHGSETHPLSIPNGILINSTVFCTAHGGVPILYNGPSLCLLRIALSHGVSGPHLTYDSLGLLGVHRPNSISIGSAVFARLKVMTDRLTDHTTPSVAISCIQYWIHSIEMWRKMEQTS